jgi:hypothetical protein
MEKTPRTPRSPRQQQQQQVVAEEEVGESQDESEGYVDVGTVRVKVTHSLTHSLSLNNSLTHRSTHLVNFRTGKGTRRWVRFV